MVLYFESNQTTPPSLIYMGKDKYENELLIQFALDCDIWFHVDKLSSAHVYLRFEGDLEDIPAQLLMDVAQLTKANSIEGNKQSVKVIYTRASNLLKDGSMDVGQVSFKQTKGLVKRISVQERDNKIINRLNKTKKEEYPDLKVEKEKREKHLRTVQRQAQEEDEKRRRESIKNARELKINGGYDQVMKEENMYSNKGIDLTKSITELEEDFM